MILHKAGQFTALLDGRKVVVVDNHGRIYDMKTLNVGDDSILIAQNLVRDVYWHMLID